MVLMRELQIADVQLAGREEAHEWQADELRGQMTELRQQMKSGTSAAMAAAVSAADARNASAGEATRLREQVTKLRAQLASQKRENERIERERREGIGGSEWDGDELSFGRSGRSEFNSDVNATAERTGSGLVTTTSRTSRERRSGVHDDGLITQAELHEILRREIALERQREIKKVRGCRGSSSNPPLSLSPLSQPLLSPTRSPRNKMIRTGAEVGG